MWKDVSDEDVWMAAESPLENDLFADFFKVPFPAPENPKFTLLICLQALAASALPCKNLEANVFIHRKT